jgi:vancomycin resistance protein VanJ
VTRRPPHPQNGKIGLFVRFPPRTLPTAGRHGPLPRSSCGWAATTAGHRFTMAAPDDPPSAFAVVAPTSTRPTRRWLDRLIAALCSCYLLASVATWLAVRLAGERWWPATLVLLGPRWVIATPLAALVPLATVWHRRSLWVLAAATGVVLFPIMGLCLPWRRVLPEPSAVGLHLRVLTCNGHGEALDRRALAVLVAAARPDVVAVEEWGGRPADPPLTTPLGDRDWHVSTAGELRIESRYPLRGPSNVLAGDVWSGGAAVRYDVLLPAGPVPLFILHLASPHDAIRDAVLRGPTGAGEVQDNDVRRRRQALAVGRAAREAGPEAICLGDFNMPSDSESFRKANGGLYDSFGGGGGAGFGWTYRVRWTAVRIDHVLTGTAWTCRHCWVGPAVGSPHRPLLADLDMTGQR